MILGKTKKDQSKMGDFECSKLQKKTKAQSEMVGFALIIVIVAVLILIFLGFTLNKGGNEVVESYEIESFIQAALQYTTECENNLEYLTLQKLIISCGDNELCLDTRNSCEILEETLEGIIDSSWKTGEDRPIKGYVFNITMKEEEIIHIESGNKTNNMKGSTQDLGKNDISLFFEIYS